jgi:hypothetical protein
LAYNYPDYNPGAGIVSDPTAPKSPPNVSMQRFPAGLIGGNGGGYGSIWTNLGGPHEFTYYCFHFRTDSNFEQHPVGTKLAWFQSPSNNLFITFKGSPSFNISLNWQWADADANNSHLGFVGSGFLDGSRFFSPGQWVQIEVAYKPSTTSTSRDGYYCAWLDGVMSSCTNQLNTPDLYATGRLKTWYTSNLTIWGGTGSTKTRDSFLYFDHWRIAVGGTAPPLSPPSPTPPPPPPTGPVDSPAGSPTAPLGLQVTENKFDDYVEYQQFNELIKE